MKEGQMGRYVKIKKKKKRGGGEGEFVCHRE